MNEELLLEYSRWQRERMELLRPKPVPKDPPCEETPCFDDYDNCMWCGAASNEACRRGG